MGPLPLSSNDMTSTAAVQYVHRVHDKPIALSKFAYVCMYM